MLAFSHTMPLEISFAPKQEEGVDLECPSGTDPIMSVAAFFLSPQTFTGWFTLEWSDDDHVTRIMEVQVSIEGRNLYGSNLLAGP